MVVHPNDIPLFDLDPVPRLKRAVVLAIDQQFAILDFGASLNLWSTSMGIFRLVCAPPAEYSILNP